MEELSLGDLLFNLRQEKGVSLQDVADGIGVSKAHIWELEKGKASNPGINLLKALANHYEVSVGFLIGEHRHNDERICHIGRVMRSLDDRDRDTLVTLANLMSRASY